ncbi:MAG: hypothetical protein Q4G70_06310 [Pseudomonadota bacterium]|nr:hypothetical protein [Pseudomonadota bacterium]
MALPAWAMGQAGEPCDPQAYLGYEPGGYKGELVVDLVWQRRVRAVAAEGGCLRYVMRAAPRAGVFDSIETLPLGGQAIGFVATAPDGRQRVFDALGRALLNEPFQRLRPVIGRSQTPAGTTLEIARQDVHSFARFERGKLTARAPRWYGVSGSTTDLALRQSVQDHEGLRVVAVEGAPAGVGLLDLKTLREVVPPRFAGAGAFMVGQPRRPWLLFGQHGRAGGDVIEFFRPDGTPLALPSARDADVALVYGHPARVAYLVLRDAERAGCHFFDSAWRPLLPVMVPVTPGHPCPVLREGEALRFTGPDARVHGYRYTATGQFQSMGAPVPGTLVAAHRDWFVVRLPVPDVEQAAPPSQPPTPFSPTASEPAAGGASDAALPPVEAAALAAVEAARRGAQREQSLLTPALPPGQAARYQILGADHQPVPDARAFEGFENLGCGHWRVLRDGAWYQFDHEGQLSTRFTVPFSC